jgi:hypothetical protein
MLGEDRVQIVEELGAVKMTLFMYDMMDAVIAEKLGFPQTEPVFGNMLFECCCCFCCCFTICLKTTNSIVLL